MDDGTHASFVTEMGDALRAAGLAPLPSRVFAALLVDADGRMTAVELAAALGASPGGISGAVRYLEAVNLIGRSRTPGTRHDVYVVQDDAWIDAMMRHDVTYAPIIAALEHALADLHHDDPARLRIDNAREFLVWIGSELDDLVIRWRAHVAERER